MAVETLLATLERSALEAADRLRAQAEAEARALVEAAQAEAERRRALALGEVTSRARARLARAAADATRALRGELLTRRAEIVSRVLAAARGRLASLPTSAYGDAAGRLTTATTAYLTGGPAELRCQPGLVPAVQAALPPDSGIVVRSPDGAGPGLLGRSADGRVTVDNTLPALLDRRRPALSIAIARRLEESPHAMG